MLPYLRQRPQSTKLWLSIYKPPVMLACQVNDAAIAVGEETITYNNVTAGGHTGVRAGQTLWVGTTSGGKDVGKVRVKSADATTITVAENSEINWADDLYLTVLDFWEVWSVFPYYVQDGETVTFYKDKNIAYTNQNSDAGMGSLVCMGTHHAAFTGDQIYWTATGTVSVSGQDPLTYLWYFGGGASTGSSSHTPGYITYNTPGHYTTVLVVETASGVQDVSYRHVSIYDRPGDGTETPILKWELEELKGSRDEGGYTAKIKVWEDVSDIVDGALVVLFADDVYGTDYVSLGGNAENRSSIVFAGYILNGTIQYNYQDSSVSFEVGSSTQVMKEQPGLSISLDSVSNPTTWYELQDLDVQKALYHYYRWHTTLLNTTDVRYIGTNYVFQYFDTEASSLYDAMSSFLYNSLLGYLISDRQNNLYAELGAETYDDLTDIPYDIDLLRQDWMNEPDITVRQNKEISYLELSGVAYSGVSTGTWTEYIAASPGSSLSYFGDLDTQTGLILVDQTNLNALVGNVFAYKNARYPNITMEIAGNYRNLDIVPLKRELLTIYPEDTHRGISFTQKPFHISEIDWAYEPNKQAFYPVVTLHELTQGYPGVTIVRPQTPITNYPELPPIELPPFPIIPLPTPSPIPPPVVPSPPPVDDITCITDNNAPANGPYTMWVSAILQSSTTAALSVEGYFSSAYLRVGSAVNRSGVIIDGLWQQSNDGGNTWSDWLTNDYWGVRSDPVSVDAEPASDPWPTARGQRTFYFNDLPSPHQIYGVVCWLAYLGSTDNVYQPTGTAEPYWLYGPFNMEQADNLAVVQNHTGTITVPNLGGSGIGTWLAWKIHANLTASDEQGIKTLTTTHVPTIWVSGSPNKPIYQDIWYYWSKATPLSGGGDLVDVMSHLITGSSLITGSTMGWNHDWDDGVGFKGHLIVETFPPKIKNFEPAYAYMIMYGGSPIIYRITIYDMYIFNICWPPSDPNGGYPGF